MYTLFYTYKSHCFYFLCIYLYRFIYIYIYFYILPTSICTTMKKKEKLHICQSVFFFLYYKRFHKNISLYKKIWYSLTYSLFCSLLHFTGLLLFCLFSSDFVRGLSSSHGGAVGFKNALFQRSTGLAENNQRWTKKGNKGICNNLGMKKCSLGLSSGNVEQLSKYFGLWFLFQGWRVSGRLLHYCTQRAVLC